ncbi:MAG: cytochrome c [Chloroflexota bacterium]
MNDNEKSPVVADDDIERPENETLSDSLGGYQALILLIVTVIAIVVVFGFPDGSNPAAVVDEATEEAAVAVVQVPTYDLPQAAVATEEAVVEAATEEAVVEAATEEVVVEVATEEAVVEAATEEVMVEAATEEAMVEVATEEVVVEAATEEVVVEVATEEVVVAELPTYPLPQAEEAVVEAATEEAVVEAATEEVVVEAATEEAETVATEEMAVETEEAIAEVATEEPVEVAMAATEEPVVVNPLELEGDIADGEIVFNTTYTQTGFMCASCHTVTEDRERILGPGLYNIHEIGLERIAETGDPDVETYVLNSMINPRDYIVPADDEGPYPEAIMPPNWGEVLTAQEQADVLAYVMSLGAEGEAVTP